MTFRTGLIAAAYVASCSAAFGEPHRSLGSHEHGHATLNIAIDGNSVGFELEAPGADIVGFEHEASTSEQKAQVEAAKAALSEPLALFQLPAAAGCVVKAAAVRLEEEEHEEQAAASSGGAGEPEAHHAAFVAEHTLECAAPDALKEIVFGYFDKFTNAQRLTVNVVTSKGQSRYEAARAQPKIVLDSGQ